MFLPLLLLNIVIDSGVVYGSHLFTACLCKDMVVVGGPVLKTFLSWFCCDFLPNQYVLSLPSLKDSEYQSSYNDEPLHEDAVQQEEAPEEVGLGGEQQEEEEAADSSQVFNTEVCDQVFDIRLFHYTSVFTVVHLESIVWQIQVQNWWFT